MTKHIGRIWINGDCISGYVVIGPNQGDIIKFGASKVSKGATFLYPSKKEEKEVKDLAADMLTSFANAAEL